jgi:hypothetical protein
MVHLKTTNQARVPGASLYMEQEHQDGLELLVRPLRASEVLLLARNLQLEAPGILLEPIQVLRKVPHQLQGVMACILPSPSLLQEHLQTM